MNTRTAYALIEQMVAIAVLGIGLLWAGSVYGVVDASGRPGHRAARIDEARELLTEEMERLYATSFNDVAGLRGPPRQFPSRLAGIRLTREVTPLTRGLLRIDLRADWRDGPDPDGPRGSIALVGLKGYSGW